MNLDVLYCEVDSNCCVKQGFETVVAKSKQDRAFEMAGLFKKRPVKKARLANGRVANQNNFVKTFRISKVLNMGSNMLRSFKKQIRGLF